MSLERVKQYLQKFGLDGRIRVLEQSSATVELAAQALGCEPCRIAKTLSFAVGGGGGPVVGGGGAKADNHKFKEFFGTKAKMLSPAEPETLVGHAVGGVCPFAVNEGVSVYLDESLRRFATVFPACGSSNSAIELTCEELERCADHCKGWADVCKLPAAEKE